MDRAGEANFETLVENILNNPEENRMREIPQLPRFPSFRLTRLYHVGSKSLGSSAKPQRPRTMFCLER